MPPTVVFDLDKVLLGGDATTLFLHGRLVQQPARLLPLFAGTPRPVLVNAGEKDARRIERVLGRRPETLTWR